MAQHYVYGTYDTFIGAEKAADELVELEIPQENISLIANRHLSETSTDRYKFIPTEAATDNRNWFQQLFGMKEEEAPADGLDFTEYYQALVRDKILLIVNREYEGMLNSTEPANPKYETEKDCHSDAIAESYLDPSAGSGTQMNPDEFNTQSWKSGRPLSDSDIDARNQERHI